MKISCSARKDWQYHIRDWVDFQRSHAKMHGGIDINYEDIDYVFGFTEEYSPLYGGRGVEGVGLTKVDLYWIYDKEIGLKLPLSSKSFNEEYYEKSKHILNKYHREGNAVIVTNDKLADRVRNEYPLFRIEASAIKDIKDKYSLDKSIDTGLYDNIVLPICANDDIDFLKEINNKDQIRLFINAECSYTCPNKVCYGTTDQINKDNRDPDDMLCSHWDLKLPRTFYKENFNWLDFYFDIEKFNALGFSNYKLLPSWEDQQRTKIMLDTQYR